MTKIKPAVPFDEEALAQLTPFEAFSQREAAIWAYRPKTAAALKAFGIEYRKEGVLPPRLVELVRLRIAFHNQCRSCMAMRYTDAIEEGVTEELVCSLEKPHEAPGLTDAERLALQFADRFATNHLSIDDALLNELRGYFDEGTIVELGIRCAAFVGFGRLAAVFGMYEDLPDGATTENGQFVPWGANTMVRPAIAVPENLVRS